MTITSIDIYRLSIPMVPFTIATGTMDYAQNIFIRIHTSEGIYGVGECSAFPMIVGETQATCYAMAQDFALLWKGKDPLDIPERMKELHLFTAANSTIKSAFDMALYDLAAKVAALPLYRFLGGKNKKTLETDLTIGIGKPEHMAQQAVEFVQKGVRIIKVKLGKSPDEDIERVRRIREAVGPTIIIRIDANQGWDPAGAEKALLAMGQYTIQFCEQPMRTYYDYLLPALHEISPVPIMADESVYDHHDADRMIRTNSCSSVNIKLAKTGGILEAIAVNGHCEQHRIPCMMGGMLESRVALTAFAHFATAFDNIVFYDMDTCLLGHKADPVTGGVRYNGFFVELPDDIGIGADICEDYLNSLQKVRI
ncbi:mandelate racemase/muconate lactonizing enzyme family protein [Flavihumibacter fluvii]|uniref:mandelate racemase/muconate lactonizing enzyme family protein n=1 Tax=Flavihumibacter fluvii TaxID=2838157 RepID=UPI001BDDDC48|nr:dipeptide epimerase [Flavihumibacter fluvii]ULQ53090.1 dipeptide epimerase [Flavihumibacter fluvii]